MSARPDFTKIAYKTAGADSNYRAWKELAQKHTGLNPDDIIWQTNEQIDIKPLYDESDIRELKHTDYTAGIPPFLRADISYRLH